MLRVSRAIAASTVVGVLLGFSACDEKKPADAVDAGKPAATPTQTVNPAPRPMPEVSLGTTSISVGMDELRLTVPSFDVALKSLLAKHPVHKPDQVILNVDRKVKTPVATKVVYALTEAGAKKIEVRTKPRGTFPDRLVIAPEKSVGDDIPGCTYVGMIVEKLGAAFWRKEGGLAKRYTRGMAGPDLSALHEVMHKEAMACESKVFLFSASDEVDWGHAYDIACSVKAAEPKYENIDQIVLLKKKPVPGKPVKLDG